MDLGQAAAPRKEVNSLKALVTYRYAALQNVAHALVASPSEHTGMHP